MFIRINGSLCHNYALVGDNLYLNLVINKEAATKRSAVRHHCGFAPTNEEKNLISWSINSAHGRSNKEPIKSLWSPGCLSWRLQVTSLVTEVLCRGKVTDQEEGLSEYWFWTSWVFFFCCPRPNLHYWSFWSPPSLEESSLNVVAVRVSLASFFSFFVL